MSGNQDGRGRRAALKGTLALAAAPAVIGTARAQGTIRWKLQSHWPKASASFTGSLGPLAADIDRLSGGRFKLEPLGAGEIAKGSEIFNVVRRGVVQMGTTSPAYNLDEAELMPQYGGIPGALREPWEIMHVTKNIGVEAALNKELESRGIFYMADKALPQELTLKQPIAPGTDLGGIKVRSAGILLEYLAAAGFAPQRVDGPELYQSLATGVVDGAHWGGTQGGLSMKLWEVAPYHMKPALQFTNDVYVINLAAYRKLPDDLRMIFDLVVDRHYYRRSTEYQELEIQALNTGIRKMGVKVQQFPDDVMARLAETSRMMLERDMKRGPLAREMGEKLLAFMEELGYA